jgi:hypothetical protein
MATLADILRQTGYAQGNTLATPAPVESPMTKVLADHVASLPQKFNENQANQMNLLSKAFPGNTYESMMTQGDPKAFAELGMQVPVVGMMAYHGTPHKILGKFDISKVGTGEGAQAYGHGMYFAENPNVAKGYQTALSKKSPEAVRYMNELSQDADKASQVAATTLQNFDHPNQAIDALKANLKNKNTPKEYIPIYESAIKKLENTPVSGNLYKVDIPDEYIPNMLDWDKPFKDQTLQVQEALKKMGSEIKFGSNKESVADFVKLTGNLPPYFQKETGHGIYSELSKQLGGDKQASEYLNSLGIKGTRYLDQQSRGKSGTSNFVTFDPSTVKILEENAKPVSRKALIEEQVKKLKD